MKKLLAIALLAVLAVSALSVSAFAANKEVTVPKVTTAPVKDGVKDAIYESGLVIDIANPNTGWTGTAQDGFSAKAYLVHDGTNLYIYAEAVGDKTVATGHSQVYSNDAFSPYFYNYAGALQTSQWYYNRGAGEDLFKEKLLNGAGTPLSILSKNGSSENAWGVEMVVVIEDIKQDLQDTALFDICYLDLKEDNSRNIAVGAGNIGWTTAADNALKLKFGTNVVTAPEDEPKETEKKDEPKETEKKDEPKETEKKDPETPAQTGDAFVAAAVLALVSAVALAGVQLSKKKI